MFPTAEREVWWPVLAVKPRVPVNGAEVCRSEVRTMKEITPLAHPKPGPVYLSWTTVSFGAAG